ncbi:MAG: GA-like domain-containing protein [Planctomycetota bacterium]|jgi:TPR repeat protein
MECDKCNAAIPDSARFCPECGLSLADVEALRERCVRDTNECEESVSRGEGSRPFIRKNVFNRLSEWRQAAELGVREAQWLLGRCYDEGLGVEISEIHAVGWHLRAAEQGYPAAQNHIGSCYQNGNGVPQDETEAVEWYRKAAEQGYAIAQANLGWCYDAGCGVAVDEAEALKWHRKAALQDDETGQYNLGVHYEWGSAVPEDKEEAAKWYRRAAAKGYERAGEALKRLADELAEAESDGPVEAAEAEQQFRTACKDVLADGKVTIDEKRELNTLAESLKMSQETVKRLFDEEKETFQRDMKIQRARDAELKFRIACKNALASGKVTVDEKQELKTLGKSLKMPGEIAKQIFEDEKRTFQAGQNVAPTRNVELQFRRACKKALADGRVTMAEERQLKNLAKYFKISNRVMKEILKDEVKIFQQNRKAEPTKAVELQFRQACKKALADGKVTPNEERELKSLAKFFNMSTAIMKRILADEVKIFRKNHPKVRGG